MKEKVFVLTRRGKERAGGAMTSVSFIDLTDTLSIIRASVHGPAGCRRNCALSLHKGHREGLGWLMNNPCLLQLISEPSVGTEPYPCFCQERSIREQAACPALQ